MFYARVKGNYSMKCTCNQVVEFTATVVKDVFVSGLSIKEIKHEVLGWTELDESSVANTLKFVEGKVMARDAMAGSRQSVAGMSSFKKGKRIYSNEGERTEAQEAVKVSQVR